MTIGHNATQELYLHENGNICITVKISARITICLHALKIETMLCLSEDYNILENDNICVKMM